MQDIKRILLHEMFIYIIGFYLKSDSLNSVGYLLGKTYFNLQNSNYGIDNAGSYVLFYSGDTHENLNRAIKQRDNTKYYSGTAQYWIDNIEPSICTKNEFVLADLICYNCSIFGKNFIGNWRWFPITYPYGGGYNYTTVLLSWATHLRSNEYFAKTCVLFGYKTIEEFKTKYKEVEDNLAKGLFKDYRYSECFESAPLLCQLVRSEKLGELN